MPQNLPHSTSQICSAALTKMDTRNKARILGIAAAVPLGIFAGVTLVNRLFYKRSNIAAASEIYNYKASNKQKMSDPIEWDNYLLTRSTANEEAYSLPTLATFRVSVEDTELCGMQTFLLNKRSINDRAVIYLHGKTYADRPNIYTWRLLDTLARKTRAEVIVPMYPLAPVHTHEEAYEKLFALYEQVVTKYGADSVTLMGDSAGAGLAAGFCEELGKRDMDQPKNLILISPWVDATLANPDVAHYEAHDVMLASFGLRKVAHRWAGGKDLKDPHVSPINGPVDKLRNVMIFAGTHELFFPDAHLFYERIHATGANAQFFVGSGLHNNYPLYPIPEATKAIDAMVSQIAMD